MKSGPGSSDASEYKDRGPEPGEFAALLNTLREELFVVSNLLGHVDHLEASSPESMSEAMRR